MVPDARLIGETLLTLCIGAAGALCFWLLGLPAAFLTGPAACVTIAAFAGIPVTIPVPLRTFCFSMIGIGIGLGVNRDVVEAAVSWPLSFTILAIVQWASIWIGGWLLLRWFRYGREEAVICAVPGLLSFVVSLSLDRGADVARVSLVQSVRVLLLALVVPVVLKLSGADISSSLPAHPTLPVIILLVVLIVVWIAGAGLSRAGVPAAHILSGVVMGAAVSLSEISAGTVPNQVSVISFVIIGSLIGTRFRGRRFAEIGQDAVAGVVITCSAAMIAFVGAYAVATLLGVGMEPLLIAFAPGGLEVMIAMSVQLGLDPAFVASHHVARLLILMALLPVMIRQMGRTKEGLQ